VSGTSVVYSRHTELHQQQALVQQQQQQFACFTPISPAPLSLLNASSSASLPTLVVSSASVHASSSSPHLALHHQHEHAHMLNLPPPSSTTVSSSSGSPTLSPTHEHPCVHLGGGAAEEDDHLPAKKRSRTPTDDGSSGGTQEPNDASPITTDEEQVWLALLDMDCSSMESVFGLDLAHMERADELGELGELGDTPLLSDVTHEPSGHTSSVMPPPSASFAPVHLSPLQKVFLSAAEAFFLRPIASAEAQDRRQTAETSMLEGAGRLLGCFDEDTVKVFWILAYYFMGSDEALCAQFSSLGITVTEQLLSSSAYEASAYSSTGTRARSRANANATSASASITSAPASTTTASSSASSTAASSSASTSATAAALPSSFASSTAAAHAAAPVSLPSAIMARVISAWVPDQCTFAEKLQLMGWFLCIARIGSLFAPHPSVGAPPWPEYRYAHPMRNPAGSAVAQVLSGLLCVRTAVQRAYRTLRLAGLPAHRALLRFELPASQATTLLGALASARDGIALIASHTLGYTTRVFTSMVIALRAMVLHGLRQADATSVAESALRSFLSAPDQCCTHFPSAEGVLFTSALCAHRGDLALASRGLQLLEMLSAVFHGTASSFVPTLELVLAEYTVHGQVSAGLSETQPSDIPVLEHDPVYRELVELTVNSLTTLNILAPDSTLPNT
jgi:hypothetical protein